jgi:hypothetical protein
MTEIQTKPEQELAVVVKRVIREADTDRLQSMCSLVNTFNFAIQVQSDRNLWEPNDFRAFCIALCAMDEIGQHERRDSEGNRNPL